MFSLVLPIAIRELLNVIVDIGDYETLPREIWIITGILLLVYVVRFIFRASSEFIRRYYARKTQAKIRCDVYSHLQTLSPRFYHDKQVGQISSRLMEDTQYVTMLFIETLPEFIIGILTIVSVVTVLFIINPLLALFVIAPLPLILVMSIIQRKMTKYVKRAKKLIGEQHGLLSDNLQGMKEIQVFGKQDYEEARFRALSKEINSLAFRSNRWGCFLRPMMDFLQGLAR